MSSARSTSGNLPPLAVFAAIAWLSDLFLSLVLHSLLVPGFELSTMFAALCGPAEGAHHPACQPSVGRGGGASTRLLLTSEHSSGLISKGENGGERCLLRALETWVWGEHTGRRTILDQFEADSRFRAGRKLGELVLCCTRLCRVVAGRGV